MINLFYRLASKVSHITYCCASKLYKPKGTVYMLHDISDKASEFSITEAQLEQFLNSIKNSNVINLSNWKNKDQFIAISIDDVPESFYTKGFPLFKKYAIPFTVFVSTELLDKPGFISSTQLKELSECELCTIGSHGTKHGCYRTLNKTEKLSFLKDSKRILSEICNRDIELFAFPYGSIYACGFNDKKLVQQFYKFGFGTINCSITGYSNMYFLPRKNLNLNSN